mgnify:CR=1 FL=1
MLTRNIKSQDRQVSVYGHFGEIIQGVSLKYSTVVLVTLPCSKVITCASFKKVSNSSLIIRGAGMQERKAALCALMEMNMLGCGGILTVHSDVPACSGLGVSTMSILATVRAVGKSVGYVFSARQESDICKYVEQASDPLMYNAPGQILWASRKMYICELLGAIPSVVVVGAVDGKGHFTDPKDEDFPYVDDLYVLLKQGVTLGCYRTIGEVATESASLNQQRNPRPHWGSFIEIAKDTGAVGISVAHTGSAISLLFPLYKYMMGHVDHIKQAYYAILEEGLFPIVFCVVGGRGRHLSLRDI